MDMVTIVFFIFLGACAIAGIVISLLAMRRKPETAFQATPAGDTPAVGRATGRGDN
jgi:hypothetical protein